MYATEWWVEYIPCAFFFIKDSSIFMIYSKFILITDYTQFVHLFKAISYTLIACKNEGYDGNIFESIFVNVTLTDAFFLAKKGISRQFF